MKSQERKEHEEEGGTRWTCAIPAQSPEVPEKSPEVPEKVPEVPDMSGSSGYSRKVRQEQAQDQVFKDAAPIPFHGINDDQDEDYEDQLHEEEDQQVYVVTNSKTTTLTTPKSAPKAFNATIRRGVTTRSCLANFCESYSFVSSLEPLRVNQALEDLNGSWMIRSLW